MEEGGNKGLWAGCILALLIAVTFGMLWYLRGNEINTLRKNNASAASAAESAKQRLERELRDARATSESTARKVGDLENRLAAEQRRVADAGIAERRFRSDLDIANSRLSQVNAELAELRAAADGQASQAVADLQSQLEAMTREKDRIAEDAKAAKEQNAAVATELSATREKIPELEAEIARLKAHADTVSTEILSANAAVAKAETEAAGRQEKVIAGLREQLSGVESALAAARNSNTALEKSIREMREKHEERLAAAGREVETLREDLEALKRQAAEAEKPAATDTVAALEEKIAELEKRAEEGREKNESLSRDLAAAEEARDAAGKRVAELNARIQGAEMQYVGRIQRASASAKERLNSLEQDFQGRIAAAQNRTRELQAQVQSAEKRLADQAAEWQKKLDAATAAHDKAADVGKTVAEERIEVLETRAGDLAANAGHLAAELKSADEAADVEAVSESAAEQEAATPPPEVEPAGNAAETTASAPEYTVVADSERHLGEIVELLSDGKTYLVTAGAAQGLQPGMRLDVHRRADGVTRYIAQLEVTNVLSDEFSMAVLLPDEPVMICPATGRAVRSGIESSPFAVTADGKPVALLDSAAAGVQGGVPAIGDAIDNPR